MLLNSTLKTPYSRITNEASGDLTDVRIGCRLQIHSQLQDKKAMFLYNLKKELSHDDGNTSVERLHETMAVVGQMDVVAASLAVQASPFLRPATDNGHAFHLLNTLQPYTSKRRSTPSTGKAMSGAATPPAATDYENISVLQAFILTSLVCIYGRYVCMYGAHRITSNHDVFGGQVVDYCWRIEFQCRGSPHLHMVVWVKDHPNFETQEGIQINDRPRVCEMPFEDSNLGELVLKCQIHRHTHTCKTNNEYSVCRFNFPRKEWTETRLMASDTDDGRVLPRMTDKLQVHNALRAVALLLIELRYSMFEKRFNETIQRGDGKTIQATQEHALHASSEPQSRKVHRGRNGMATPRVAILLLACVRLVTAWCERSATGSAAGWQVGSQALIGEMLSHISLASDAVSMEQRRNVRVGETGEPEKTRRPAASSGTILTCRNPGMTLPGIEPGSPWWEASRPSVVFSGSGALDACVAVSFIAPKLLRDSNLKISLVRGAAATEEAGAIRSSLRSVELSTIFSRDPVFGNSRSPRAPHLPSTLYRSAISRASASRNTLANSGSRHTNEQWRRHSVHAAGTSNQSGAGRNGITEQNTDYLTTVRHTPLLTRWLLEEWGTVRYDQAMCSPIGPSSEQQGSRVAGGLVGQEVIRADGIWHSDPHPTPTPSMPAPADDFLATRAWRWFELTNKKRSKEQISWCLLTTARSRCTQQETVTTVQLTETECIPTTQKRAARDPLHMSCGFSCPATGCGALQGDRGKKGEEAVGLFADRRCTAEPYLPAICSCLSLIVPGWLNGAGLFPDAAALLHGQYCDVMESGDIWAALNIEVLRADYGEVREEGLAMAFVRDPSQHSPGVISEDHEKQKSGRPDQESNPDPPECESSELPLRHLARFLVHAWIEHHRTLKKAEVKQPRKSRIPAAHTSKMASLAGWPYFETPFANQGLNEVYVQVILKYSMCTLANFLRLLAARLCETAFYYLTGPIRVTLFRYYRLKSSIRGFFTPLQNHPMYDAFGCSLTISFEVRRPLASRYCRTRLDSWRVLECSTAGAVLDLKALLYIMSAEHELALNLSTEVFTGGVPSTRNSFPHPVHVYEGDDALITCVVRDVADNTVVWRKENRERHQLQTLTADEERVTDDKRFDVLHDGGESCASLLLSSLLLPRHAQPHPPPHPFALIPPAFQNKPCASDTGRSDKIPRVGVGSGPIDLEAGVQATSKVVKDTGEDMLRDGIDICDHGASFKGLTLYKGCSR
ncbi:hypothetical protein PR048_006390 [Dryococelus australis]|uniref:Ig-like domain-containing protein n=1 Tax=Dryococelus australis TaxID=614101 RepID=A0ABQ9IAU6_9NEOP|nr:hypothetical protein PR048_006390 [Dryococelus australis]